MAGDSNQIFRIEYIDEASRQPCCPRRTGSLLLAASERSHLRSASLSIRFHGGDYNETIQSPLKKVPTSKGRDKPRNKQRGRRRLLGDALRPGGQSGVTFSTFAVHAGELDVGRQQVAHVGFIWQERRRRALCRQVGRRLLHDALDWLRAPLHQATRNPDTQAREESLFALRCKLCGSQF